MERGWSRRIQSVKVNCTLAPKKKGGKGAAPALKMVKENAICEDRKDLDLGWKSTKKNCEKVVLDDPMCKSGGGYFAHRSNDGWCACCTKKVNALSYVRKLRGHNIWLTTAKKKVDPNAPVLKKRGAYCDDDYGLGRYLSLK